jgi:hypothetical protein
MMKKRLICALAALGMVMSTYIPARAEYAGNVARDSDFTIEIQNTINSTTTVTVYYLDRNGLDVIGTLTVQGPTPVRETFPRPGRGVTRVIIDVDPTFGTQTSLRLNDGPPITMDEGKRLVFNTF